MRSALGVVSLLWALTAASQVAPEREAEVIQSLYEAGQFAEAGRRARESLALNNFSEPQRVKLHEIAALSAFNLGEQKEALASFLQLLRVNPDYILDPFAVSPAAIKIFEQLRKEHADALNLVRQQIAIRAEQEKRAAAERERVQAEQEERRRKAEAVASITVREVEKRPMVVNLLPFGAGQFQQGRMGWGGAFAISEGLTAVLSIVSFFAIESLFENVTYTWTDRLTADGMYRIAVRQIPPSRRTERDVWTGLKYGTGIAFYALWAIGIGEALWHHQDEVITERKEAGSQTKVPSARLNIFPTQGGLGAGLTIGF